MNIDIRKSMDMAWLPIIIIVVLAVICDLTGNMIVLVPSLILSLILLIRAGYMSVKLARMSIIGGAVTGALVGLISGVIHAAITILQIFRFNLWHSMPLTGIVVVTLLALFGSGIVCAIIGAILGTAGAYIATIKK